MKVKFTDLAVFKLSKLTSYLTENWSAATKIAFLNKLNVKVKIIQQQPFLYPESNLMPGIRKCVVTKQCSFYYEVKQEVIYILNIIDNRQDPIDIYQEIKKLFEN